MAMLNTPRIGQEVIKLMGKKINVVGLD